MKNQKRLKICFERVVPDSWICHKKQPIDHSSQFAHNAHERLAVLWAKRWRAGCELRCRFLHGSEIQRRFVEEKAKIWESYANISFKFVTSGHGDIRIAFNRGEGSWSAHGTDAQCEEYFPRHQPTMNFGWLNDHTSDREFQRVVLHEFGHALGCVHEHQSPESNLDWDRDAVVAAYKGPPNYWSEREIETQIFQRRLSINIAATRFDPKSIMLYSFKPEYFYDGIGLRTNYELSDLDKKLIRELYPGR